MNQFFFLQDTSIIGAIISMKRKIMEYRRLESWLLISLKLLSPHTIEGSRLKGSITAAQVPLHEYIVFAWITIIQLIMKAVESKSEHMVK